MKLALAGLLLTFMCALSSHGQSDDINIIPRPLLVHKLEGEFRLSKNTKIVTAGPIGRTLAGHLNRILLRDHGFQLEVVRKSKDGRGIFLLTDLPIKNIDSEAYDLVVSADHIEISGTKAGAFYALQTLTQLARTGSQGEELVIPPVVVADHPRFKYRGMHLDVARHFEPVEFVKKYIDLMSQYKFNYFHWHLTDDQGWRIPIKKYPKLTEIGSTRPETVKERNLTPYIGDGIPHTGSYTREQIKDVIAYAKERYITVVPEIELPGHASAALAAYPQFG
jgi:hexosaminidase